jgi:hypothetical protein
MVDLSILETDDLARELGMARLREMALTKRLKELEPPGPEPTPLDAHRAPPGDDTPAA